MPTSSQLEETIRLACMLEATARKPGNVHPEASFDDLTHADMLRAGKTVAPILANSATIGVGETILRAVQATKAEQLGNANLGIVLLLAPLAAVPWNVPLRVGIADVLASLTVDDAVKAYEAIRLANPGGLGDAAEQDVAETPTVTLLEAMTMAADRDFIAAQYANGFADVLELGRSELIHELRKHDRWEPIVIGLQLRLMAKYPDSLIARKCGADVAEAASQRAQAILECGWPESSESQRRLIEFDRWLRADGNKRNPGTTADLVAACLFVILRESEMTADVLAQVRRIVASSGTSEKSI